MLIESEITEVDSTQYSVDQVYIESRSIPLIDHAEYEDPRLASSLCFPVDER